MENNGCSAGPLDVRVGSIDRCRRCGGEMAPGKAIAQTYAGIPDFPGKEVVTLSPGGPGVLVDCLKCRECGHSVTANAEVTGA